LLKIPGIAALELRQRTPGEGTMYSHFVSMALAAVISVSAFNGAHAQEPREILAPSGKLRVGVYLGSPTSMVRDSKTGEIHGLSLELGKELAKRLNVAFEQKNYQRISDVLEGIKAGDVDFTISNSTPARAEMAAFSQTLLTIELGYLVPANSKVATMADVQRPGVKVGVTQNSTSQGTIPKILPNATIVPAQNFKTAIEMFARGEIDVYATNKPTLFEMSDQMPGSKVLDGRWGEEHLAVAIPKGHDAGIDYISGFVQDVQASGLLAQAAERAGLRGVFKGQ
jgi:polar amino acid transport system substrate-binding protein